jgi:hypothetical protein
LEERVAFILRAEEKAKQNLYLLHADFLLGLFFGTDDKGDMFLRNVN